MTPTAVPATEPSNTPTMTVPATCGVGGALSTAIGGDTNPKQQHADEGDTCGKKFARGLQ